MNSPLSKTTGIPSGCRTANRAWNAGRAEGGRPSDRGEARQQRVGCLLDQVEKLITAHGRRAATGHDGAGAGADDASLSTLSSAITLCSHDPRSVAIWAIEM